MFPGYKHDVHATFWSLATLGFPEGRRANLQTPRPSEHLHNILDPDEHLLCYDYLYYVGAYKVCYLMTRHYWKLSDAAEYRRSNSTPILVPLGGS
jgi:hypothetical protein